MSSDSMIRPLCLTLLIVTTGHGAEQRGMSTDRPDVTESPFTVGAGRSQIELDVIRHTRDREEAVRVTEWALATGWLRHGLTERLEVGVSLAPQLTVVERTLAGEGWTRRGVGDTKLRAKMTLFGGEGGPVALGVIPEVKLPTATGGLGNERTEAALTLPVAFELGEGWSGGAMTSAAWAWTERGRRAVWANSVTVGHALFWGLGGFCELTSTTGEGTHAATFDFGITRRLGPETQLDVGAYVGISRAAPDLTIFCGIARRF